MQETWMIIVVTITKDAYSSAVYAAKRRWRFSNLYAGNIIAYLVAFLIGIFAFYYFDGFSIISNKFLINIVGKEFYQTAIHATVWGCMEVY
jgi:hypothetical protein